MILRTPRLELDEPDLSDAELFAGWLNDKEIVKYSEQRHLKHNAEFQRVHWRMAGENHLMYTIHSLYPEGPIGSISARIDKNNNVANVGILLGGRTVWGQGYGFEAWEVFCNFLFIEKGIRKIEAGCMSINAPMIRICTKYGMRHEAIVQDHFLVDGKPVSMHLYGSLGQR